MQGAELQGREIRVDMDRKGYGSGGRGGYGSGGRGKYGSTFFYVSNSTCVVAGGASEDCKLFVGNLSHEVSI